MLCCLLKREDVNKQNNIRRPRKNSHLPLILVLEPLMQSVWVELQGSFQASFTLNLHDCVGAANHFNETHTVSQWQTAIGKHTGDKTYIISSKKVNKLKQKHTKRKWYTDRDKKRFLPQVQSLILPNVFHDFNNLQCQHVLPQVWNTKSTGRTISVNNILGCTEIIHLQHISV